MATEASLTLSSQTPTDATFAVTLAGKRGKRDQFSEWVAVNGYAADGTHCSAAFAGVVWGDDGHGVATVSTGVNPDFPPVRFVAFVAVFPDVWTPVSNTVAFSA